MKPTSLLLFAFVSSLAHAEPAGATKPTSPPPAQSESIAEGPAKKSGPPPAAVSSLKPEELDGFDSYPPPIQQLVRDALELTTKNLTYTFGSASPKQGGMDCSGTIYYLLQSHGLKAVPRQSNEICAWVRDHTLLRMTPTADSNKHPELAALQPGDLLFWSGTYDAGPREIPVTHVMLYLGRVKKTGKPIVFGASDGRTYQSERRTGVSVFDFSVPTATSKSRLYGYGLIPGVGRIKTKETPVIAVVTAPPTPAPAKAEPPKTEPPKTEPTKEVIQRAITPPPAKPTAKPAPVKKPTKPKTTATTPAPKKKPAPKEPTVQEKILQGAQKAGDAVKDFFKQ